MGTVISIINISNKPCQWRNTDFWTNDIPREQASYNVNDWQIDTIIMLISNDITMFDILKTVGDLSIHSNIDQASFLTLTQILWKKEMQHRKGNNWKKCTELSRFYFI